MTIIIIIVSRFVYLCMKITFYNIYFPSSHHQHHLRILTDLCKLGSEPQCAAFFESKFCNLFGILWTSPLNLLLTILHCQEFFNSALMKSLLFSLWYTFLQKVKVASSAFLFVSFYLIFLKTWKQKITTLFPYPSKAFSLLAENMQNEKLLLLSALKSHKL